MKRLRYTAVVAAGTVCLTALAASPALSCAPTPREAADAWARAHSSCDFARAWFQLHPSEREAAQEGMSGWTQEQARQAIERLTCHTTVERVETSASEEVEFADIQITYSTPVSALEFGHLLDRRRHANVLQWATLDQAIDLTRARLLAEGMGTTRVTYTAPLELRRFGGTLPWCVFLDLAAAKEARDAEIAASRAASERRASARRATEQRAAAALPAVSLANVARGESTLRETGVFGEVVNGSTETLRRVEVEIEFLDSEGRTVETRRHSPIWITSRSSSDQPLPTGQRRRWGYRATDITAAWSGALRARVVAVEIEAPGIGAGR